MQRRLFGCEGTYELFCGNCLDVMKSMPENSIDAVVTDPPAGISFMGKDWDRDKGGGQQWVAWMSDVANACLRVVKPGGHALVWSIPRTSHWTGMAWEDAGWEPRDKIYHAFGSGFPKSADVSKMIDKHFGAERGVVGVNEDRARRQPNGLDTEGRSVYGLSQTTYVGNHDVTAPATEEAKQYEGYGTALKPAVEEWWLFRKPISEKTIVENVLRWGTGGLNIDGSRIEAAARTVKTGRSEQKNCYGKYEDWDGGYRVEEKGRWPANLILDGSEEVVSCFPEQKGENNVKKTTSRFFKRIAYFSKASKRDRDEGCEGLEAKQYSHDGRETPIDNAYQRNASKARNSHPTVKSANLMRYLIKLVMPPQGGIVLDPFAGSGSTIKAALLEGVSGIGIELSQEYIDIAHARCKHVGGKEGKL